MSNGNESSLIKDPFAAARSHNDAEAANDTAKASAQAALILNGGAATAVFAYIGKGPIDTAVLYAAPVSLTLYAAGVCLAAWMLDKMSSAFSIWSDCWREVAYDRRTERKLGDSAAQTLWQQALRQFRWSTGCFIVGSALMAVAFLAARYYPA
jgi:hypothetical protein